MTDSLKTVLGEEAPIGILPLGGVEYEVLPLNFKDIQEFGDKFEAWDELQKSGKRISNKEYATHIPLLVWAMIRKSKRTRAQIKNREFAIELEDVEILITPKNHQEVMTTLANFTKAREEQKEQSATASA